MEALFRFFHTVFTCLVLPLSSNRQHYHINVSLEDNREDY